VLWHVLYSWLRPMKDLWNVNKFYYANKLLPKRELVSLQYQSFKQLFIVCHETWWMRGGGGGKGKSISSKHFYRLNYCSNYPCLPRVYIIIIQRWQLWTHLLCRIWGSHGGEHEVAVFCHLCNVGKLLPDYTALQPRRQPSSYIFRGCHGLPTQYLAWDALKCAIRGQYHRLQKYWYLGAEWTCYWTSKYCILKL
jgi:hypothetical protein